MITRLGNIRLSLLSSIAVCEVPPPPDLRPVEELVPIAP
jgi:hypothetical protein